MADMVGIVNYIRAEGSTEYQDRVPLATQTNIAEVGAPILTYSTVQNEFLTAIVNKIAMQMIHNRVAKNPLGVLKKGSIPLGSDIEEIFTNMAEANTFDPAGSTLLTRNIPDTKTVYHRLNRKDQYSVTISRAQLQTAFTAWGKLEELVTSIVNSMYSGDNFDEFILMKNLMADAIVDDKMQTATVTAITDSTTATAFVKAVRNAVSYFQFPSSSFNKYADASLAADPSWDGKPVITWTPMEDQILILRADIATEIDVDVLAQAFNIDKTTLLARTLVVDTFGAATNCYAVLADRSFFQVYDNLNEMTEFYNPKGMYWNYYWNHWQTYGFSYFANAVAFVTADVDITAFDTIADVDGGTDADPTYADAAAVQAVLPDEVWADDGSVKVPVASWTETDTYNAGVAGSYTFTAVLGDLPYGYTNTSEVTATVEVVVAAG